MGKGKGQYIRDLLEKAGEPLSSDLDTVILKKLIPVFVKARLKGVLESIETERIKELAEEVL